MKLKFYNMKNHRNPNFDKFPSWEGLGWVVFTHTACRISLIKGVFSFVPILTLLFLTFNFNVTLNGQVSIGLDVAQSYEEYLFNTKWTLSECNIQKSENHINHKRIGNWDEFVEALKNDFPINQMAFEFGDWYAFELTKAGFFIDTFAVNHNTTNKINGHWVIDDTGGTDGHTIFNIYADENDCPNCDVNFDFVLEIIDDQQFIISFVQSYNAGIVNNGYKPKDNYVDIQLVFVKE